MNILFFFYFHNTNSYIFYALRVSKKKTLLIFKKNVFLIINFLSLLCIKINLKTISFDYFSIKIIVYFYSMWNKNKKKKK